MLIDIDQIEIPSDRGGATIPKPTVNEIDLAEKTDTVPPVMVRTLINNPLQKRYVLVTGTRHWMTAQRIGLQQIDAVVRDDINNEDALSMFVRDLDDTTDPITEAEVLKAQLNAIEGHSNVPKLAFITGITYGTLHHKLRLLQLHKDAQRLIREGKLSISLAKILHGVIKERQRDLALKAVSEHWTVRQLTDYIKGRDTASDDLKSDPNIKKLENDMTDELGFFYRLDMRSPHKGLVTIRYDSLEELEHINERLRGEGRGKKHH